MIRLALEKDLDLIIYFINKIAEYEKMSDDVVLDKETLRDYLFNKKIAKCKFIMEDNKEVGFALYFYNFSTFKGKAGLYLEDIFILEEYRHKGYGKKLFLELVKEAKENNLGRMEWTCLNWNEPSIKFYKSLGAISLDEWKTYRLDELQIKELV
jgi:GNAT superfamily N-acetyltransferase